MNEMRKHMNSSKVYVKPEPKATAYTKNSGMHSNSNPFRVSSGNASEKRLFIFHKQSIVFLANWSARSVWSNITQNDILTDVVLIQTSLATSDSTNQFCLAV